MLNLFPYYLDFKHIILSGFNPKAGIIGTPTFPMWGYGFLLIITEDKIALLTIQNTIAIISLYIIIKFIETNKAFQLHKSLLLLKVLIILSIPFFAFHSIQWPYSISISLTIISLVFFVDAIFYAGKKYKLIISASLFGLALNFRSDYYLLPLFFFLGVMFFRKNALKNIMLTSLWLINIYSCLIPWAIYTHHITGTVLLTSTNAGHVFFVGLGELPNNIWGIECQDYDPLLHKEIADQFGAGKSSLTYDVNKYLLTSFKNKIKQYPCDYIKKVTYSLTKMVTNGVYPGEFYTEEYLKLQSADSTWIEPGDNWHFEPSYYNYIHHRKSTSGLIEKIKLENNMYVLIETFSLYFGKLIVFIGLIFFPLYSLYSIIYKNYLIFFSSFIIFYQIVLNSLAYSFRNYTSNIYLLLLLAIVFLSDIILKRWANEK